jgi:hypothetical protein
MYVADAHKRCELCAKKFQNSRRLAHHLADAHKLGPCPEVEWPRWLAAEFGFSRSEDEK